MGRRKMPWIGAEKGFFKGQPKGLAAGYCNNYRHKGRLSVRQIKQHECIQKNCPLFKKNENHPYWIEKAKRKELKKQAKEEKRKEREEKLLKDKELDEIVAKMVIGNVYTEERKG